MTHLPPPATAVAHGDRMKKARDFFLSRSTQTRAPRLNTLGCPPLPAPVACRTRTKNSVAAAVVATATVTRRFKRRNRRRRRARLLCWWMALYRRCESRANAEPYCCSRYITYINLRRKCTKYVSLWHNIILL